MTVSSLTFVGTGQTTTPAVGQVRFNAGTNNMELFNGQHWHIITAGDVSTGEYRLDIDQGRVFGAKYHTVEPVYAGDKWHDMMEWIVDTFGPTSDDGVWTPGMRWYANNAKFWFRNKKDLDWFVLRWSTP